MSDTHLVERARQGDERAFRVLYDATVDRIYRLAYRMAGDPELARDFTQETFVRAFQRLAQFRGDSAFSTWVHSIAISVTLNGLRKSERHRSRERSLEEAHAIQSPHRDPEPGVRGRIEAAVDGLPDIYRTVFVMHDLEGYSHGEIAASLGVAEGTSKARLFRARSRLREVLGAAMEEYA
ncbi:MAG: RNA polymerase sigma factor [Gemmatimonadales bacterium]